MQIVPPARPPGEATFRSSCSLCGTYLIIVVSHSMTPWATIMATHGACVTIRGHRDGERAVSGFAYAILATFAMAGCMPINLWDHLSAPLFLLMMSLTGNRIADRDNTASI
ncbi:hypothetical protein LXA43DRAFT_596698 [Ganoderma leucocontextum]|nr:hypothetical protein LXA43DRAFT_596698 [Ganoderma leucocontextum]